MAWTTPRTFTAGSSLSSADLNLYLRDNMLETMAAKATEEGGIFCASATNEISERLTKRSEVLAAETTTSFSYTDLATSGPAVTITSGSGGAICWFGSLLDNNTSGFSANMSVTITGAAAAAAAAPADDDRALVGGGSGQDIQSSQVIFYDGLTAGSNTFTCKYRVSGGGTGTFRRRRLVVFPF